MALQPESSANEALSEAHTRIVQSEERWRSVFENSAIGVALADLNGRFITANPVFQNMLGYTQEELGQFSFIDITVEEGRKVNRVRRAIQCLRSVGIVCRIYIPSAPKSAGNKS